MLVSKTSQCRVHVAGVTAHPDSAWVTRQASNLVYEFGERSEPARFLVHDRDSKYTGQFDEVFRTEGVEPVLTPSRAPRANVFAERWVRTVRAEYLDWKLILSQTHLERVLRTYAIHYNTGGRDILGGLIHEYQTAA